MLLFLLPLLAQARILQIEFVDALLVDRLRNATLCLVANATLKNVTLCNSIVPVPQTSIFMAAMQFNVLGDIVDIYAQGNNLTQAFTAALHAQGFFTLDQSYVSQLSDVDRPTVAMTVWNSVLLGVLLLTTAGMYNCATPPRARPPLLRAKARRAQQPPPVAEDLGDGGG
jgi:hypothetical protein